jgi:hypothetical protein
MGREPVVLPKNVSMVGTSKGDVYCEKQSTSKMEWDVTGQKENGQLQGHASVRFGVTWTLSGAHVEGNE